MKKASPPIDAPPSGSEPGEGARVWLATGRAPAATSIRIAATLPGESTFTKCAAMVPVGPGSLGREPQPVSSDCRKTSESHARPAYGAKARAVGCARSYGLLTIAACRCWSKMNA